MDMRSPLGRIRGLGSSNDGVHHWWVERLSGLALVPLFLWFVFSAVTLVGADLATFTAWVGHHYNPVLLVLLIICMFHHGQLALQTIFEDYIHSESIRVAATIIVKFTAVLFGGCSAFAVIRLTFGG